jgi:hypothetical protein
MNKTKKESFFWTSYSDLMTSLFFIMLVLFILTIAMLHSKIKATENQLKKIKEIEESIKNINSQYFEYDSVYKRHTIKNIRVSFKDYSFNMNDIDDEQKSRLEEVGLSIKSFVDSTLKKNPSVKYLLIIEGQSSKDNYYNNDYYNNDVLSYQRALSLFNYWSVIGINFNANHCEAIISGSGQNSPFRLQPDDKYNKGNQRFVIHIIPKPGIIEASKAN